MKTIAIDDDPFCLQLLSLQLGRLGHSDVRLYEHAGDAVALLEQPDHGVELIFCDLQMPQVDGVEIVRHLVRLRYQGQLVLISAEDRRILQTALKLAQAHNINVLGALSKPVSVEQLRTVLARDPMRRRPDTGDAPSPLGAPELALAIASGELVNHYQPQVNLRTGELVGVESLVRWQHPVLGMVYPDRFIGIAEQHQLMDDLTDVIIARALDDARQWRQAGLVLQLGVNISMANLVRLDFPEQVVAAARRSGMMPSSLMLEVTESRLMSDPRAALDILTRLRLKRIRLSIDDFGTGHSSLAQLHTIPFEELKLDRSFVSAADTDGAARAIVEGALAMTRLLQIQSVAEGVETRADWSLMRKLGCDLAQGYFIARPMPASQLLQWRAEWQTRCPDLLEQGMP